MDSLCNVSMYSDGIIVNSMKPEQDSKIWKKKKSFSCSFFFIRRNEKKFLKEKKRSEMLLSSEWFNTE